MFYYGGRKEKMYKSFLIERRCRNYGTAVGEIMVTT